jgi:copper chaperone CopZ
MVYVHRVPGRLRVRSGVVKQNPKKASELLTAIGTVPGVKSVDVNTVTGSILVHHDPFRLSSDDLLAVLGAQGISGEPSRAPQPASAPRAASVGATVARAVVTSVLQHAIERSIVRLLPAIL